MRIGIDECDAVNVAARFAANLPHEADFGFFGGIGQAQGQEFVGREAVSRDNAGTVTAEHDGFRFFRKHFSGGIGAEQDDSYFFRDTSASAFSLHRPVYALGIGRALRRSTTATFESWGVRIVMRWNAMGKPRFEWESEEVAKVHRYQKESIRSSGKY